MIREIPKAPVESRIVETESKNTQIEVALSGSGHFVDVSAHTNPHRAFGCKLTLPKTGRAAVRVPVELLDEIIETLQRVRAERSDWSDA